MEGIKIGSGEISSFERICLRESGMRITSEYEIIKNGDQAEISLYFIQYRRESETDERVLQKSACRPAREVLEQLNKCRIAQWDGFNGPNPPGLLDGTQFIFRGVVDDGKKLYASGSNNYPKHYRELTDWFYAVLQ